jgi:epoxyqueuosine reductase
MADRGSGSLGNWLANEADPPPEGFAVLVEALSDPEALVRGHAAWALGRVGSPESIAALEERGAIELHEWAGGEIQLALNFARRAG